MNKEFHKTLNEYKEQRDNAGKPEEEERQVVKIVSPFKPYYPDAKELSEKIYGDPYAEGEGLRLSLQDTNSIIFAETGGGHTHFVCNSEDKRKEARIPTMATFMGIKPNSILDGLSYEEVQELAKIKYSDEPLGLQCTGCGMWSTDLEEVCHWDINGHPINTQEDIDKNANNPDALAYTLCDECAEEKFLGRY